LKENHKLYLTAVDRSEQLQGYKNYVLEIKENLRELKAQEESLLIKINKDEVDRSTILTDLELVAECLGHNRYSLAVMQKELENGKSASNRLSREIAQLQQEIKNKGQTIGAAMDSLAAAAQKITEGEIERGVLFADLVEKENALHEAYFAYGTFKEMQSAEVAEKKGGILGFGAVKALQADFNTDYFSKIDMRLTQEIPIYRAEAALLSSHPADSFEWIGDEETVEALKITDPEKFWKSTKYLAVLVE